MLPTARYLPVIWLAYALIGIFSGFMAGYLGIGGGLILVPALSWVFSHDPATANMAVQMAVATSLASMLFSSLSSVLAHHHRRAILWALVKRFTPGLMLGALAGSFVADSLSSTALGKVFGCFALLIGLQMLRGGVHIGTRPLPGWLSLSGIGLGIGSVSSLLGIGGGSMTVPWLIWHGKRAQHAIATAAACGYPIALAGTVGFILLGEGANSEPMLGYVHLQALLGVSLFSVLGAPAGAAAVHRSTPLFAKRVFAAFLMTVAAKMLFL